MRLTRLAIPCASFLLLIASTAAAQPAPLAFEVASIKPGPPPTGGGFSSGMHGGPGTSDPGRITLENMSLQDILSNAYHLKSYQLTAPDWLRSARFDIIVTLPPNTTKDQVPLMWQTLLADRFKLAIHRETKELPIYTLVVAKGGPKMTEAPSDHASAPGSAGIPLSAGFAASGSASGGGGGIAAPPMAPTSSSLSHMGSDKMSMTELADSLSRNAGRPVVDQTGLTGRYKISLEYQREDLSAAPSDGPSIFAAVQEQLGLKLEPAKGPIEMVVVDHLEKSPIEN